MNTFTFCQHALHCPYIYLSAQKMTSVRFSEQSYESILTASHYINHFHTYLPAIVLLQAAVGSYLDVFMTRTAPSPFFPQSMSQPSARARRPHRDERGKWCTWRMSPADVISKTNKFKIKFILPLLWWDRKTKLALADSRA